MVNDSTKLRILGDFFVKQEDEYAEQNYSKLLYSLGSLALTCISWGKISSSLDDVCLCDPQYLFLQQQFIPLDCPELLEAIAYTCCDITANQLPTLPFISHQLSEMIPDIQAWELQMEQQHRAAVQSDAMGAARTAKRFSLLFNTDDFHQQLTQFQPTEDHSLEHPALHTQESAENEDSQHAFSPLRHASHRTIRPSMYIPRTTQSQNASHEVPISFVRLNEQLLNTEYDLAQSVQELENPFVREEYVNHHPEALQRIMSSIQMCLTRIQEHVKHLQFAATGSIPTSEIDIIHIDTHIPAFGEPQSGHLPLEIEFISPAVSVSPSPPSATSKLFASYSEGEADDLPTPIAHSSEVVAEAAPFSDIVRQVHSDIKEQDPYTAVSTVEIGAESASSVSHNSNEERKVESSRVLQESVNDDQKRKGFSSSNKIRKFTAITEADMQTTNRVRKFTNATEKEMLHPVIPLAVASENESVSSSSVWFTQSLTDPVKMSSSTFSEGDHEFGEIVIAPSADATTVVVNTEPVIPSKELAGSRKPSGSHKVASPAIDAALLPQLSPRKSLVPISSHSAPSPRRPSHSATQAPSGQPILPPPPPPPLVKATTDDSNKEKTHIPQSLPLAVEDLLNPKPPLNTIANSLFPSLSAQEEYSSPLTIPPGTTKIPFSSRQAENYFSSKQNASVSFHNVSDDANSSDTSLSESPVHNAYNFSNSTTNETANPSIAKLPTGSQQGQGQHSASVSTLPAMTSPLATASHFLDKIRHLDEMFSTMSGPDPVEEEKRVSPLQVTSPLVGANRSSFGSSKIQQQPPSQSYFSATQSPYSQYRYPQSSFSSHNFEESPNDMNDDEYYENEQSPPQQEAEIFLPEKQQQLQQTLDMYLSLVQRCSNASARAKKVIDHLDSQISAVSNVSTPTSNQPSSGSRPTSHPYGIPSVPSPFNPTASSRSHNHQTQSSPHYMQPKSSSYSLGSHSSINYNSSASPGRLSRMNSSSSSRATSASASIGSTGPYQQYSDRQPLSSSASSVAASISGSTLHTIGSRSNSGQRGHQIPIRTQIGKEVLSTRTSPRVYSISPGKR